MGLCSVMVPVGSMLSSGALIVFKAFVNRVGRGPVVCIGLNIVLFFALCHNVITKLARGGTWCRNMHLKFGNDM